MRGLRKVDSSADLAHILDDGTTPSADHVESDDEEELTAGQRLTRLIFGTKGGKSEQSPTARLRLFIIAAFLVLHALNLCTTLTAKTAFKRYSSVSSGSPTGGHASILATHASSDPQNDIVAALLQNISAAHSATQPLSVHLQPPVILRMILPGYTLPNATSPASIGDASILVSSKAAILDRFMSGWTRLVGDPVLSKWIVIVLIVSVFLNGYLLKGIATGDQGIGEGFVPVSPTLDLKALPNGSATLDNKTGKTKRRPSYTAEKAKTEWTLAEAAAAAKERRKELIADAKERDAQQARAEKVKARSRRATNDSSDESNADSPLFISSKKRISAPLSGRLVTEFP